MHLKNLKSEKLCSASHFKCVWEYLRHHFSLAISGLTKDYKNASIELEEDLALVSSGRNGLSIRQNVGYSPDIAVSFRYRLKDSDLQRAGGIAVECIFYVAARVNPA